MTRTMTTTKCISVYVSVYYNVKERERKREQKKENQGQRLEWGNNHKQIEKEKSFFSRSDICMSVCLSFYLVVVVMS